MEIKYEYEKYSRREFNWNKKVINGQRGNRTLDDFP